MEYFVYKQKRNGKWGYKSRDGAYLGVDPNNVQNILVFDFNYKRKVPVGTYTVLKHIPTSWTLINPKNIYLTTRNY